jgi:hypothetical protein
MRLVSHASAGNKGCAGPSRSHTSIALLAFAVARAIALDLQDMSGQ